MVGGTNNCPINLITRNEQSIFLDRTTDQETISTFVNLGNSTFQDIDGLQIKPPNFVIDMIAPFLAHIFILVFLTGVFPKDMQQKTAETAKIIVLHKVDD